MQLLRICQGKKREAPWKTAVANRFRYCCRHAVLYAAEMKLHCVAALLVFVLNSIVMAQTPAAPTNVPDYSGMYSFLKEGEFMQVTIEDAGAVSGFISRYGDTQADKGSFVDQFFKSGKLDGKHLTFTTQVLHGTWFTFDGSFDRGTGKNPQEEGYYVLRGTLTRNSKGADEKVTAQSRKVEFKSFPRDVDAPAQ